MFFFWELPKRVFSKYVVVPEVPLEEVGSPKSVEDAPLEAESPKCAGVEGPAPDC